MPAGCWCLIEGVEASLVKTGTLTAATGADKVCIFRWVASALYFILYTVILYTVGRLCFSTPREYSVTVHFYLRDRLLLLLASFSTSSRHRTTTKCACACNGPWSVARPYTLYLILTDILYRIKSMSATYKV